jgi:signal transduction histidine kinase
MSEESGGIPSRRPQPAPRAPWRTARVRSRVVLWAGFAAATLSLAVLLALQYRWLAELETSTALARRAILTKVLEVVSKEAYGELKAAAEPAFHVDASDLSDQGLAKLAPRLGGAPREAVRTLFVMGFSATQPLRFLDPKTRTLVVPEYSDETLAVWSAAAPWMLLAKKGANADGKRVHSDERDPRHRMLLRVITEQDGRIVGLVGVVVDERYFAGQALPKAIRSTLSSFPKGEDFAVFVGNERGEPILPGSSPLPKQQTMVSRRLTAPFSDWWIAVQDRRSSAESWARRNFALEMGLSLALALLLLGAILLTTRSAAREMRLSAMKSDFVSNVSHELRTPLASIRVFGELMRSGRVESPEKMREYGERIEAEALRLGQLVENILDFSRIESGRKAYRFEEVDFAALVCRVVEGFAARIRSRGFRVELRDAELPLPRMSVDTQAIDQALCNILENAVKYSGEARDVVVRLARQDGEVVVAISDHGIGIPRDEQGRIFERFHRVGTGLVHEVRGAGLGLAIVRHVVLAHGGRVEVKSAPGEGSTFSIVLPIAAAAGPQRTATTVPSGHDGEAG